MYLLSIETVAAQSNCQLSLDVDLCNPISSESSCIDMQLTLYSKNTTGTIVNLPVYGGLFILSV